MATRRVLALARIDFNSWASADDAELFARAKRRRAERERDGESVVRVLGHGAARNGEKIAD